MSTLPAASDATRSGVTSAYPAYPWKIVVGTDGSGCAVQAQELLRHLALPAGTAIHAVGVALDPRLAAAGYCDVGFVNMQVGQQIIDAERQALAEATREAEQRLAREGCQITSAVRAGDISHEIVTAAAEFQADLVVVGTRGRSRLDHLFLGSTAHKVARTASCSVLVSRGKTPAVARVVLAVDGSESSSRAIRLLGRLPLPPDGQATVVHVCKSLHPVLECLEILPGARPRIEPLVEPDRCRQREHAEQLVHAACQCLANAGKTARPHVALGDPADEICSLIRRVHADLVVAGARGVSGVQGLLVGSVADRLLQHAPCSVLLAR